MTNLDRAMVGVTRLGLDTAPVIYFIEANPVYDDLVTAVFRRMAVGEITGITSVITVIEVLTQPIRSANTDLQQRYRDLLFNSANFETVPISFSVALRTAELRSKYNLRTPDALQVAAAIESGCQAFLTNDKDYHHVTELQILVLSEFIE